MKYEGLMKDIVCSWCSFQDMTGEWYPVAPMRITETAIFCKIQKLQYLRNSETAIFCKI